jgi:hypothetical protein
MNRLAAPAASALLAVLVAVVTPAVVAAQVEGGRRPRDRDAEREARDTMPSTATRGYQFGVTTFGGGTWQPSGIDAGMLFRGAGPVASYGLGIRAGNFIQNQAVLFGGSQGFFLGAVANMRVPLVTLFKVGLDRYPTLVRLELVPEVVGEWNIHSPMAQGRFSVIGSALFGFSIGAKGPMDQTFLVLVGPAWFGPSPSEWHAQVSLRFTSPLRSREAGTPPPN